LRDRRVGGVGDGRFSQVRRRMGNDRQGRKPKQASNGHHEHALWQPALARPAAASMAFPVP
jgi:hypothetical protein